MFVVEGTIVSTEVFTQNFICNLSKCKGACCWEGDFGAPVSEEECQTIDEIYPTIEKYLSAAAKDVIQKQGKHQYTKYVEGRTTPLLKDGACVYLFKDADGIAKCAFEKAYLSGETKFKKPISCHLYPIRVSANEETEYEALNYDEWEICKAACALGDKEKVPVFRFLREAIERKYGKSFYDQLEDIYASYFG